jgi:sugar lactone lactonase YvrE
VLIPVRNRRDLVFDPTRDLLYITTDSGLVQRYDVANQKLLSPWKVGTSLNGADITPDGSTLYVADFQTSQSQGVLHQVDLNSGSVTDVAYDLSAGEGGTWDVAVANNGKAFFSTLGSGSVPFRQLDLSTGAVTIRTDAPGSGGQGLVTRATHIDRSADGSQMFMAESTIFTYDAASDSFPQHAQTDAFYFPALSAVNRDGSLVATQLFNGPFIGISVMDRNLHSVRTLAPNFNGGLTFDPSRNLLYLADATAGQIVALDTNTWTERFRLNIGEFISTSLPFDNGEMTVSNDDSELFLSTTTGVRMINLPPSTGVASRLDVSGFPALISAGTVGSFTVTARDPAGGIVTSFTGTVHLSSTDPAALLDPDYTYTPADQGVHTFHAILQTAGTFSLTATDFVHSILNRQANIQVHTDPVSLIPVTNRRGLVFDGTRGLLYITTSDGLVERYDLATQTLLAPWKVGASLYGADITPDGAFLYTSEGVRAATGGILHKVNLNDGTVTNITYSLARNEGGTWAVTIADNGKALFDARYQGSGGTVPLRQLDLSSDAVTIRADVPGRGGTGQIVQDTDIRRGADRSLLFLTASNNSSPIIQYDPASDAFPHSASSSTFFDYALSAVNRDGSLIATELVNGPAFHLSVSITDRNFHSVRTLAPNYDGLTFDPTRDVLYVADAAAGQVVALDTHTWAEKFRLNIGEAIPAAKPWDNGEMTVSDDGSELFLSTPSGVRVFALPANPGAVSRFVVSGFPRFTGAGRPGSFTVTAVDGFGDPVPGYTGTVHFSSTDPSAQLPVDYTFSPDNQGTQTFTATFNTPGTYTLFVQQVDDPTLTGAQAGIVIHDSNPVALIPVANRRGLVYDAGRGLLYITTSDGLVERYDLVAQTLLAPWHVGASLYGADISPDGAYLYTTEAVRGVTQGMLHQVNLNDGTVTNLTYDLSYGEGGTWAVIIANNGKALFTSFSEGSGSMPIYELDLATDVISNRDTVSQHIRRGKDRSLLFLMDAGGSNGPIHTYDPATDSFPHSAKTGMFLTDAMASVSRDGSLIAMAIRNNLWVLDPGLNRLVALANPGSGLVFDPTRDVLYAATSTQIIAYDTHMWMELYRFDIGQTVPAGTPFGNGEMTVSDDGSFLFFSTPTGVRVYSLGGGGHARAPGGLPWYAFLTFGAGSGAGQPIRYEAVSRVGADAWDVGRLSDFIGALGLGARPPVAVLYGGTTGRGVLPPAGFTTTRALEGGEGTRRWDGDGDLGSLQAAPTTCDLWAGVLGLGLPLKGGVKDLLG